MLRLVLAMAIAVAFGAGHSSAATVSIEGVDGAWGSVVSNGNSLVTGTGTPQLRWGRALRGKKSGYGFKGFTTNDLDLGEEFQLGTFTHFNNPIGPGTSITETTLSFSVDLMIDGVEKSVTSAFRFLHFETPNLRRGNTCANGGKNFVGVNAKGCADRVTFASVLELLEEFQIGDAIYTMEITGFLVNGKTVSEFWTRERARNSANLVARLTKVREVLPPPPVPVPLPASGLLVLAGLGALVAARRRRA